MEKNKYSFNNKLVCKHQQLKVKGYIKTTVGRRASYKQITLFYDDKDTE